MTLFFLRRRALLFRKCSFFLFFFSFLFCFLFFSCFLSEIDVIVGFSSSRKQVDTCKIWCMYRKIYGLGPRTFKNGKGGGRKFNKQKKITTYFFCCEKWCSRLNITTPTGHRSPLKKKKKKLRVLELRTPTFVMGPGIGTANRTRFLSVH